MKTLKVEELKVGQVLFINGRNGKTQLCPFGNMIVGIERNEKDYHITVHGWDGDYNIVLEKDALVEVE
jgi:hypothetical protein